MTKLILALGVAVICTANPAVNAQLAAPGPSGVVMGHLHLTAKDGAASRAFWAALGGQPVQNGTLQLIQLPGTFVMVRQGQPTAGTAGSAVDRITFRVRDLKQTAEDLKTTDIVIADGLLDAPDGIGLRLVEDKTISVALQMDSLSIATIAPAEAQAWYVKQFGATAGTAAGNPVADLPGVRLVFTKASTAPAPTRGRSLDHIGFDLKGLEDFCRKLEAGGIKLDRAFTRLPNSQTAIAFLTDPWGTYIELTENLAPQK